MSNKIINFKLGLIRFLEDTKRVQSLMPAICELFPRDFTHQANLDTDAIVDFFHSNGVSVRSQQEYDILSNALEQMGAFVRSKENAYWIKRPTRPKTQTLSLTT